MPRNDAILTHPVPAVSNSEAEMMRYMRSLERSDLALSRAMIPCGLVHHEAGTPRREK